MDRNINVLVIHNDNLPSFLLSNYQEVVFEEGSNSVFYFPKQLFPKWGDLSKNYDTYLSEQLSHVLKNNTYDLVVVPFALNVDNYLEFTGLRVALHIRLTKDWGHQNVPILFIGPEGDGGGFNNLAQVIKLSELGDVLVTPGVYSTNATEKESIEQKIISIVYSKPKIDEDEYSYFLNRIQIQAPANYDTHHSIANEWAVMRWAEMLGDKSKVEKGDFADYLFYKFLDSRRSHQKYKNKDVIDKKIEGIKGKIIYIDDEYGKGWKSLFSSIFESSGCQFKCFEGFSKSNNSDSLIRNVTEFIDQNDDADCVILDLRLHDADFELTPSKSYKMTGVKVMDYIQKEYRGMQVVVFSASNKLWNAQLSLGKEAAGYVVKESPELTSTREDSKMLYDDFVKAVKLACDNSFKRGIIRDIELMKVSPLYDEAVRNQFDSFVDILIINNKLLINTMVLQLLTIVEHVCVDNFDIDFLKGSIIEKDTFIDRSDKDIFRLKKIISKDDKELYDVELARFSLEKKGQTIEFYDELKRPIDESTHQMPSIKEVNKLNNTLIIAVLKYVFNISNEDMNRWYGIKCVRNHQIGHLSNGTNQDEKLVISDLRFLFDKILHPLFGV